MRNDSEWDKVAALDQVVPTVTAQRNCMLATRFYSRRNSSCSLFGILAAIAIPRRDLHRDAGSLLNGVPVRCARRVLVQGRYMANGTGTVR